MLHNVDPAGSCHFFEESINFWIIHLLDLCRQACKDKHTWCLCNPFVEALVFVLRIVARTEADLLIVLPVNALTTWKLHELEAIAVQGHRI